MNLIRFLFKLPPYVVFQSFFIFISPILLIITMFAETDWLGSGFARPAPETFREWMNRWLWATFNVPYSLFWDNSL